MLSLHFSRADPGCHGCVPAWLVPLIDNVRLCSMYVRVLSSSRSQIMSDSFVICECLYVMVYSRLRESRTISRTCHLVESENCGSARFRFQPVIGTSLIECFGMTVFWLSCSGCVGIRRCLRLYTGGTAFLREHTKKQWALCLKYVRKSTRDATKTHMDGSSMCLCTASTGEIAPEPGPACSLLSASWMCPRQCIPTLMNHVHNAQIMYKLCTFIL